MIGTSLGPYRIIEQLGAGGMGEVYLGEDTRLGRKVAIKVLPEEYASDPERLARFEQEARAAAALNHPHIAVVHDIGTEGDTQFMVQEYLEGQSLRERLDKGALPLAKALDLAIEVGEALIAAHKAGIVHRDLKPDNIFVTEEGHAKVLDFGLAKLTEMAAPTGTSASMSPTMLGTVAGQVMGTAGYMAPEQVNGEEVDSRADLFAFGAVLYETVTGRRAFTGESVVQTLSKIAHEEPVPMTQIIETSPGELHRIVRKCLAKEPGRRYQAAADLSVDLRQLQDDVVAGVALPGGAAPSVSKSAAPSGASWRVAVLIALASILLTLLASSWLASPPDTSLPSRWLEIVLPANAPMAFRGQGRQEFRSLDISPDGTRVVYVAEEGNGGSRLYFRMLDDPAVTPIEGTQSAYAPFFSPDGRSVAFFAEGQLRKVALDGGGVVPLSEVESPNGGVWVTPDRILVSEENRLVWFSAATGDRQETLAECSVIRRPCWMPDVIPGGDWVVVTSYLDIAVVSLVNGERRTLSDNLHMAAAQALPNGDIAYFHRPGQLWVLPFDAEMGVKTGEPVGVLDRVRHAKGGQFAVAADGTLVYAAGGSHVRGTLTWATRDGEETPLGFDPDSFGVVDLSPDGRTAVATVYRTNAQIWSYDLERGTPRPLVTDGFAESPVVSPDGNRVAYVSVPQSGGVNSVTMVVSINGTEDPLVLVEDGGYPNSWLGDLLGFTRVNQGGNANDLYAASLEEGGKAEVVPVRATSSVEDSMQLSPDGKWFTYTGYENDQLFVFVEPYPSSGGSRWPVSSAGGAAPRWSRGGAEIVFWQDGAILAVDFSNGPEGLGPAQLLLPGPYLLTFGHALNVHPDGTKFLVIKPEDPRSASSTLTVIQNWLGEVERPVPEAGR